MLSRRLRRRQEHGQSLVEFALVFPIFVLLLAGMIQFGIVLCGPEHVEPIGSRHGTVCGDECYSTAYGSDNFGTGSVRYPADVFWGTLEERERRSDIPAWRLPDR